MREVHRMRVSRAEKAVSVRENSVSPSCFRCDFSLYLRPIKQTKVVNQRYIRGFLAGLLLLAGLSAFAQKPRQARKPVDTLGWNLVFTPTSPAQAQFAGYYAALEMGFYAEEGLNVTIVHPFATQSAVDHIRKGKCQATVLPLSLAMRTVESGLPLVNILQTSMNSATLIISRWGEDPRTLKGAKVTAFRAGFGQLAKSYSELENLDYQWVTTASSSAVNLFVSGAVDATMARSFDEYYKILQSGLVDPEKGIYRFEDGEYNIQQDGVYVTRTYYETHRAQAEAFARASRRGWEWAAANPEKTLDIVMRYVKEHRIATNRTLQGLMLQEVLRLQKDHESGVREFRLRPDMIEKANDMLLRSGGMTHRITKEDLLP